MYRIWNFIISQKSKRYRLKDFKRKKQLFSTDSGCNRKSFYGVGLPAGIFGVFYPESELDKPYDGDELHKKYVHRDELDWKERLDLMWRRDLYYRLSPELEFCSSTSTAAFVLGFFLGAYKESRTVYMKFMAANKQTMFKHPREAQAIMQEQMTYHMMKGGIRWSVKIGLVVSFYVTMCQTAHTVRNYINPLDHAAVGFATGAIFRTMGGPKSMLAAGIIGSAMGLIEGSATWSLHKLSGETIKERWLRELQEIQVANAAIDKERNNQANIIPESKSRRLTEAEWQEKEAMEEEALKKEKRSAYSAFAISVFDRAKELTAPTNIDLTYKTEDKLVKTDKSSSKESLSELSVLKSTETKSVDDVR